MTASHKTSASVYLDGLKYDPNLNHSWFAFFINRSRLLILVIAMILTAGLLALRSLPLESQPEVDIGIAIVSVALPGASPETIEDQVIKKLEKEISKVKGISKMTASAQNSVGVITVEFSSDIQSADGVRDLKDKVDLAKPNLPSDAKEPVVKEISFDDNPVWTFSIGGNYNGFQLYDFAKKLRDEIEKDPLVSEARISGGDETEFTVFLDPSKLERYGLTVTAVNQAISSQNFSIPVGDVQVGEYVHKISVDGRYFSVRDLSDIAVVKMGQAGVVHLRDLGTIQETAKKRTTLSRLSSQGDIPTSAVTLGVVKRRGGSIVNLVDNGQAAITRAKSEGLIPSDLKVTTVLDMSERIKLDLHHLIRDGLITFVLVFLALLTFTGFRPALVASSTVPLVFMATFTVMSAAGQTLNFLSMFSLILSLGLLVDDAIVVVTAINQYLKTGKFTAKQAALLVMRDYKRVLISTTLTVVWIFAAMMFMSGIIGKFIFSIPFVITITLLSSLLVALLINPALSVVFEKVNDGKHGEVDHPTLRDRIFNRGLIHFSRIEDWYAGLLSRLISSRRAAWRFVIFVTVLFFVSLLLPITGILKSDFFPATDQDLLAINLELPVGTRLDVTSAKTALVEELLVKEKEIASFTTMIGSEASLGNDLAQVGENYAGITISLVKKEYGRKETSMSISERLRKEVENFSDMKVTVTEMKGGPPAGQDFELRIAGPDFRVLESISGDVIKALETVPGAINIQSSRRPLPLEFRLNFDPTRLSLYDLTLPQVASFLRNAVDGTEATKVFKGKDEIVVRTRYTPDAVQTSERMKDLKITNLKGQPVFIRDIVSSQFIPSVFSIDRIDQKRIISVTAAADKSTTGGAILIAFNKAMENYQLPSGYEFITGGANDENAKSVQSLFVAMAFGMMFVIATLVVLYDSYRQAMIVLVTIPFSLIGVFWGLTLFGQPLSFPGLIGLVALFGIVVRNGIIFFDKINQNRSEGFSVHDSIVDAGRTRLEPEVLTSLCTILGMMPLTFSNPTWTSLGLSIMFGLAASTLLTLRVLPGLYYLFIKEKPFSED